MNVIKKSVRRVQSLPKVWRGMPQGRKQFVLVLLALWVVIGGAVYHISATRAATEVAAQNAARLSSLRAEIDSLPKFSEVKAGETSGLMPHVQTTREQLVTAIDEGTYRAAVPSFGFVFHPAYWQHHEARFKHKKNLDDIREQLQRSIDDARDFSKFVGYSPTIDLGTTLDGPDAGDRIERTKDGLVETRSALLGSGLEQSGTSIEALDRLIKEIDTLTTATLPDWSKDITTTQQQIIDDLDQRDVTKSVYAERLIKVTQSYQ